MGEAPTVLFSELAEAQVMTALVRKNPGFLGVSNIQLRFL
jgi:hypothetical protein